MYCLNIFGYNVHHIDAGIMMVPTHNISIFLKFVCIFLIFSWPEHKFQKSRHIKQTSKWPFTTTYLVLNKYGLWIKYSFVFLFTASCFFTVPSTVNIVFYSQSISEFMRFHLSLASDTQKYCASSNPKPLFSVYVLYLNSNYFFSEFWKNPWTSINMMLTSIGISKDLFI